ncbi:MAG: hypothetical protein ABIX28_08365 [Vicinamibacterales bacterium]
MHDSFGLGPNDLAHAREKCPLVRPRDEVVIDKDAVALVSRYLLKWHGDQVPESALRPRVLTREQAVIGVEADVGPLLHRLGKKVRSESACQGGRNGGLEEQRHMPTAARPSAFEGSKEAEATAALKECHGIGLPTGLVEIDRREEAGLVEEQLRGVN